MSIATEIARLQSAKMDIKSAIVGKGVTVPSEATLNSYGALIWQISGESSGVGDFTRHQRITVTPTETLYLEFDHSLGVVPKLVVINGNPDTTSIAYLTHGVLDQIVGGIVAGSTNAQNAYKVKLEDVTSLSNGTAGFSDAHVKIRQATSARYWDTETMYTVDLYA